MIVLDASNSVTSDNFKKMLDFCKAFLANADIESGNNQAGILSYSTNVKIEFQIGAHSTTTEILNAIDGINYSAGWTNTADTIKTMASKMFGTSADRVDAQNIGIIITDGKFFRNMKRTIPEAEEARRKGIHIYSIGIGLTDTAEVFAIATPPSENNSFIIQNFNELSGLDKTIFSSICQGLLMLTFQYFLLTLHLWHFTINHTSYLKKCLKFINLPRSAHVIVFSTVGFKLN